MIKQGTAVHGETEAEIREHIDGQAASYQRLRQITFVEAIPKSAAGKILRRVLREQTTAKA